MPVHVSLGELLTQWWRLPNDVSLAEIYRMDFDEFAAVLEIECPDAHRLDVQIYNVDINSQGLIFVTFSAGGSPDATH
ncbi:MAG: hypothetical protein E3J82_05750 [Candidatus Thorarchaeota archaeon]|nr:MAG: hypothetical protein E3J82_05750 [Candidatus Thorarchaeota archaeon]